MSTTKIKTRQNFSEPWDDFIKDAETMLTSSQDKDEQRRLRSVIKLFEYRKSREIEEIERAL